MSRMTTLAVAAAAGFLAVTTNAYAQSAPIILTNASPDWKQLSGATWVLPACTDLGCENEPSGEATGVWYGNTPWDGTPSVFNIYEADGSLSDVISFDSLGPNGTFRVQFFSDPNPGLDADWSGYTVYTTLNETDADGVISDAFPICCQLTGVSVSVASDGESPFHPYGATFDVSDGIQFTGNVVAAPEPSTWAMMVIGFAGLGYAAFYRSRKAPAFIG